MLEAEGAKTLANAQCLQAVRQLNLESNGLDKEDIETKNLLHTYHSS